MAICMASSVKVASKRKTLKMALKEKLVRIETTPKAAEMPSARNTEARCAVDRPAKTILAAPAPPPPRESSRGRAEEGRKRRLRQGLGRSN